MKNLLIAFVVCLVVVGFGILDDWFAQSEYGGDGIAYFDIANAVNHGDWHSALNPYWSIGYPLALDAARWMFPAGWAGEWTSIRVVNLVIFVMAYASFLYFLKVAGTFAAKANGAETWTSGNTIIFVAGSLIFVEWQVQVQNVSCTMPDLMLSGIYLLLMSAALQFCLRPAAGLALLMGLCAGVGYLAKVVFLPLSFLVFLTVLLRIFTRANSDRFSAITRLMWAAPPMAMLIIPYVLALSVSQGRLTLGESGSLNYAWTVNGLPHWHWLGGPAPFGEPLHPIRVISESPHVYEFGEPLHLTYPPWSNPFYWYEGYHHFFSLKNQVFAIESNLTRFSEFFFDTPHAPIKTTAAFACVIAALVFFTDIKLFARRLLALWPVWLPSLLGMGMYMIVYVEGRYVVAFLDILLISPLLALFIPSPLVDKRTGALILVLISIIALTSMVRDEWPALGRALRDEPYTDNEQWRVGLYLTARGASPGAKVAVVRVENGIAATWAYVAGLHIAGQIGNQDLSMQQQQKDYQLFIGDAHVQETVLNLFRENGGELAVVFGADSAPSGTGWEQIPTTRAWVHWL